ncbi:MAG: putative cytokinetic ring protein SteA [Bowdeniella nasicola]|nr:putative cytokinetic ring protein SteA [Bowdeniella nasicola]
MSLFSRRAPATVHDDGRIVGRVQVDPRTKDLTKRLQPGDIAVIDHADLDRVAAEALVRCQVAAVLNAAPSTTGRYPNLGPGILLEENIPLIDDLGGTVMDLTNTSEVTIDGAEVWSDGELVAAGIRQTAETIRADQENAKQGLSTQLEAFAANTMDYLQRERALLLDGVGIPDIKTSFANRHALIVVRGYHYREDLQTLRPYVREYHPVIIGVDGGADAVLEAGLTPDVIVGDMDSVSDKALKCGAEIVVHAYRDGKAPGRSRVEELGIEHTVFPAAGTSEDIAMLLADEKGAELVVAVGTHATLVEFLDKGRAGMSSTFLTRLRVGGKLVDAKGVSRLYRTRISSWQLFMLSLSGILALVVAIVSTTAGQTVIGLFGAWWDDLWSFVRNIFAAGP